MNLPPTIMNFKQFSAKWSTMSPSKQTRYFNRIFDCKSTVKHFYFIIRQPGSERFHNSTYEFEPMLNIRLLITKPLALEALSYFENDDVESFARLWETSAVEVHAQLCHFINPNFYWYLISIHANKILKYLIDRNTFPLSDIGIIGTLHDQCEYFKNFEAVALLN